MSSIDTRGMSKEKVEALEVTEAARETAWENPTFVGGLFMGKFQPELIFPYPEQSPEDKKTGDELNKKIAEFLKENVDADKIDETTDMPDEVLKGLADLGCFGMKIPEEYGGLGLSQVNYNRAIALISSYCGSTAVWLSAHQSIGLPQPLKLFGTDAQKKKYLPLLAKGKISAFALTECEVGSDPAQMKTTATPSDDGKFYYLNGEKLWCTNGPKADYIVVMALTPSILKDGKEKKQITAFIVETSEPGFKVSHRCDFMGIRGIQNGLIRFENMKIPAENILWKPGRGLKLALMTLNVGRLTLPAACTGLARQCLNITRRWCQARKQWGAPIGEHESIGQKLANMAAYTFAMESVTWLSSALVDKGGVDIRLEAAMTKLFCSEAAWNIIDETMQIRGGRGYEKASSLRGRGEHAYPVERMMRDCRINTIIEGSSEIMRLFIAREALDPHLKIAGDMLNYKLPASKRINGAFRAFKNYCSWYPSLFIPSSFNLPQKLPHSLKRHIKFIERKSRKLSRTLFHAMAIYQNKLEKKQAVLNRIVDIGTELFVMSSVISRACMLSESADTKNAVQLAVLYCSISRRKIKNLFKQVFCNDDRLMRKSSKSALSDEYKWLEYDIVNIDPM